jgi:hypothetical protein
MSQPNPASLISDSLPVDDESGLESNQEQQGWPSIDEIAQRSRPSKVAT